MHFLASIKHSTFEDNWLDVRSSDGEVWVEAGVSRGQVERGEYDEALICLDALSGFPENFPTAYQALKDLAATQPQAGA
ncbi:hypothetical protein D3C85_1749460 [compost metagenome]